MYIYKLNYFLNDIKKNKLQIKTPAFMLLIPETRSRRMK